MRAATKIFLLSWAVLGPAIAVGGLPLCGLIFGCGCTLTGGARHCNIHSEGPHCPWCARPVSVILDVAGSIAGASALMLLALKWHRASLLWTTAAGALGFLVVLSAAALLTAKLSGYPFWYGLRVN